MPDRTTLIARHLLGHPLQSQQRLQFPVIPQQRKHFHSEGLDRLRLGTEGRESSPYLKPNKLDTSDIEGARPRANHLTKSERQLRHLHTEPRNVEAMDELDRLAQNNVHRRELSLNQLGGRMGESRGVKRYSHVGGRRGPVQGTVQTAEDLACDWVVLSEHAGQVQDNGELG